MKSLKIQKEIFTGKNLLKQNYIVNLLGLKIMTNRILKITEASKYKDVVACIQKAEAHINKLITGKK